MINKCSEYMNAEHVAIVQKACDFATYVHREQFRKSGEPYIVHPIQVAAILAELKMDPETVSAGFLHDVVEDTPVILADIGELFGKDIEVIVDGVTKLSKIRYKSHREQLAENHRKLLLAMSKDLRVIIVKLADRLHNMRTLKHLRPDKQRRIANETLEIYAPLADRLGISTIKWELEDTSLRYLNPQQYYRIVHLMNSRRDERLQYINEAIDEIKGAIVDETEVTYQAPFRYLDTTGQSLDGVEKIISLPEQVQAPVKAGDVAGEAIYLLAGNKLGSVPIIFKEDVPEAVYKDFVRKAFEAFLLSA